MGKGISEPRLVRNQNKHLSQDYEAVKIRIMTVNSSQARAPLEQNKNKADAVGGRKQYSGDAPSVCAR